MPDLDDGSLEIMMSEVIEDDAKAIPDSPSQSPQVSPIAVCLFDPAAYPEDELRELCLQDRLARQEIDSLYFKEPECHQSSKPSSGTASSGEPTHHKVMHQDGSKAELFV